MNSDYVSCPNPGHLCSIGAIERMVSDYKYCQGQTTSITVHPILVCLPGIQLSWYTYVIRKQYIFNTLHIIF